MKPTLPTTVELLDGKANVGLLATALEGASASTVQAATSAKAPIVANLRMWSPSLSFMPHLIDANCCTRRIGNDSLWSARLRLPPSPVPKRRIPQVGYSFRRPVWPVGLSG